MAQAKGVVAGLKVSILSSRFLIFATRETVKRKLWERGSPCYGRLSGDIDASLCLCCRTVLVDVGGRSALAISVFQRFIVNTIVVDRNLDTFFFMFHSS